MKYNKIMKNIVTVLVYLMLLCSSLYAADTTWGDSLTEGVRESSTTGLFTPSRYAIDADEETYWTLSEGESEGWIEQYWETEKYIKGAVINLETKENTVVQLFYDQNGTWIPIPGGTVQGNKNGTVELSFTEDLKKTKRVLVTLRGSDVGSAKLYSLTWKEEENTKRYGKILPESYTFSHTEYINLKPSRLWNGLIANTWFEPIWNIPWEVQQAPAGTKPAGVFAPYMGNPSGNGEIIWQLDGEYNIQTLKAYFSQGWRSIAFEFWNGSSWTDKQTISESHSKGWHRIDLKKEIKTTKIRISFPGGWEFARFINQIEVWGEGERNETVRSLVLSGKDSKGNYQGTITDCDNALYSLEYIVEGRNSTPVQNIVNGKSTSVTCAAIVGNDSVFVKQLTKDALKDGTQFVSINTGNTALRGAVLREIKDKGQIRLGSHYTDGFTGIPVSTSETAQKEKKFILDREYNLEAIQVYTAAGIPVKLYTDAKKKNKVDLQYNTKGYWAGSLKGLKTDTIILTTDQPVLINEIELFGSPESDTEVSLELWWPGNGTQITGQGKNGDCLIGWMGDPLAKPVINGEYYPRQMGNVFWMPLSQMQEVLTTDELYSVTASLNGKSSVKEIKVPLKKGSEQFKLDNASCEYISGNGITISGNISKKNTRCLVNGKEVGISNNKFSSYIEVPEGYTIITVELWDKNLKKRLSILEKEVYRSFENPIVTIDSPYSSMWTQNSSVLLSGRVGNGEDLRVYVDGVEAVLEEDRYVIEKSLQEGNQTIHVVVKDNLNRMTEQTVTLLRDSTVPVIQLQYPHEQEYIAHSDIEFILDGNPDESLWWQFNTEPWEAGTEAIKKKTYILEDNYYTFTIQAQDRSGNKSSIITVNFCVDVTPPKNFTIKDNVEGWTNNNTPTIEFATSDATAGVDYYEYKIDEELWSTVESPFILPVLEDGIREIYVRAVDRAGNKTENKVTMYIDTSLPPEPQTVRPVPSDESITMKWVGIDDGEEFQEYRIERNPAWSDGVRDVTGTTYGKNEYTDTEVEKKQLIHYRVWAVDRAGNESSKSEWYGAQVGLASTPIIPEQDTRIEFDKVVMDIPQGATAEDIIRIQINELPENALFNKPVKPLISKIYQVTVVRSSAEGEIITNHADLFEETVIEMGYDPSRIPEEYSEEDLKPYYYDTLWGYWIPIEGGCIDTKNKIVSFKTDHFTEFAIQATKEEVLSPQQMIDGAYNPFKSKIGHGEVSVSLESGGVSTSFTELSLPGKNGLDLVLQRVYSTGAAQKDRKETIEGGSDSSTTDEQRSNGIDIDGETPWKIAAGWKINMPSLKWNGSSIYVTDVDGNSVSLGQMKFIKETQTGNNLIIEMENHEYSDQTILLEFEKNDHYVYLPWGWDIKYWPTTYKFLSAVMTMADGRLIVYDQNGRVTSIHDKTLRNAITFRYENTGIAIIDTYGRDIVLLYKEGTKNIDTIQQFDLVGKRFKTISQYTIDGGTLSAACDIGGRLWNYRYSGKTITTKTVLSNPPSGYEQPKNKTKLIQALSFVSGPGIGETIINYISKGDLNYTEEIKGSDGVTYKYNITTSKLLASTKTVKLGNENQSRTIAYTFTLGNEIEKQFPMKEALFSDLRTETKVVYSSIEQERLSFSQAPEALRVVGYKQDVNTKEAGIDVLTYETERRSWYKENDTKTLYSYITQDWDTTLMRVTKRSEYKAETESEKLASNKTTEFTYDTLGNITTSIVISNFSGRKTIATTVTTYMPKTALYCMNLPKSVTTTTESSDSTSNHYTKTIAITKDQYAYNQFGQMTSKQVWHNNTWNTWSYTYDTSTGELRSITTPEGQKTEYVYDLSNPNFNSITKTINNVELGCDTTRILVSTQLFDKTTGELISDTDADGYTTGYTYDALGRLTNQTKNGGLSVMTVVYDDTALRSTVTNENKGITINQFDSLGRLIAVNKINVTHTLAADGTVTPTEEVITTDLQYDEYDQVKNVRGPVSSKDGQISIDSITTSYNYDSLGRVIKVIDAESNTTEYSYDTLHNITTITDAEGRVTQYQTDWDGNTIESKKKSGSSWIVNKTYYDGAGRVIESIDGRGYKTVILYNELGLESEVINPETSLYIGLASVKASPKTVKTYNASGFITNITAGYGSSTTVTNYVVNGLGWVLETKTDTDTTVNKKTVSVKNMLDGRGNVVETRSGYIGEAQLHTKKWTYDFRGNVLSETNENNETTTYSYDAAGNRTKVIDPRDVLYTAQLGTGSFTMSMEYDLFNRLIKAYLPKKDSVTPEIVMAYDGRGNLKARKDPEGVLSFYTYNRINKVLTEKIGAYTTTYAYDKTGLVSSITSPTGLEKKVTYDSAGRVWKETTNDYTLYTEYSYDNNNNTIKIKDQNGNVTEKIYNELNQNTTVINALGIASYQYYDALGNVVYTLDGERNDRYYTYDRLNRLISETTPLKHTLQYTYDAWGNVVTYTDANKTVFTRTYTATNQLSNEAANNGTASEYLNYTYDVGGALKTASFNGSSVIYNVENNVYTPNPYGLITSMKWGTTGIEMKYTYDSLQRLTSAKTPLSEAVTYSYNTNSQVTSMSSWINGSLSYTNALLSSYTAGNGIGKAYSYDAQKRVSGITYATQGITITGYEYQYDFVSNITSKSIQTDKRVTNSYNYDSLNQLIGALENGKFEQQPDSIDPDVGIAELDYVGDKNPEFIEITHGSLRDIHLDSKRMSITYDLKSPTLLSKVGVYPSKINHRVRERDIALYYRVNNDGQSPWIKAESDTYFFTLDTDGVITYIFKRPIEAQFIKVTTIWDDRNPDNTFADYATLTNGIKELFRVWTVITQITEGFVYDYNGNKKQSSINTQNKGYSYYTNSNGGNTSLLKYDGTWYYTYDANGNRTMKGKKAVVNGNTVTIDTNLEYWVYTWDLHNRLTSVQQIDSSSFYNKVNVSYTYDALNYRITRTGKDGTTHYAYGRNGALTYEKNLTTGVIREYAYLNDQIIGWKETDSTGNSVKRYASTDLLGSVTTVTDESGTVLWSGEYTAFGNVAYGSGDVLYEGMYTGKDIDSETGLTYHWNRWRSEDGSSFISEDPARDGSNWYGYCGNNPINSTDPTGLYVDYSQGGRKEVDDTTGKVVCDISNNGTDNLAGGPEQGPTEPKKPEIKQPKIEESILFYNDYSLLLYRNTDSRKSLFGSNSLYSEDYVEAAKKNRGLDVLVLTNNKTGEKVFIYGVQTVVSHIDFNTENTVKSNNYIYFQYLGNNQSIDQLLFNDAASKYRGPVFNIYKGYTDDYREIMTDGYIKNDTEFPLLPIRVHSDLRLTGQQVPLASGGCPMYPYSESQRLQESLEKWGIPPGAILKGYVREIYEQ